MYTNTYLLIHANGFFIFKFRLTDLAKLDKQVNISKVKGNLDINTYVNKTLFFNLFTKPYFSITFHLF